MITVIGGTYREIDYDNVSHEIFGSGFRCSKFLLENKCNVKYLTSGNAETAGYLRENQKVYPSLDYSITEADALITFKYKFSLSEPTIMPGLLNIRKTEPINAEADDVICYGMLENDFSITTNRVVYDPQTAVNPRKFSDFGLAKKLIYIVNKSEAVQMSLQKDIQNIKRFFFEEEQAIALIIKNGPYGATLYHGDDEYHIPSFQTDNVNKIGSGDIFTASFGYYWMEKGLSLSDCAKYASMSTAFFCDIQVYVDTSTGDLNFPYPEFTRKELPEKQIYIAAPFFSLADLILVNEVRDAFLAFEVKVFSPFHDIGLGDDIEVARKDLAALNQSDIVFGLFDNLDSGTFIESGYAMANKKIIIGYQRTRGSHDFLMLKPANLKVFNNLTTAIYQTIWNL